MHCVQAFLSNYAVNIYLDWSKWLHRDEYANSWEICLLTFLYINTLEIHAEMPEIEVINDNKFFAPYLLGLCVKLLVIVLVPHYFSLGAVLPQKNTLAQSSHLQIHTMTSKTDGGQLSLSNITSTWSFNFIINQFHNPILCSCSFTYSLNVQCIWFNNIKSKGRRRWV